MKVEWQIEDVRAGRRVGKPGRKEQWMICYSPSGGSQEGLSPQTKPSLWCRHLDCGCFVALVVAQSASGKVCPL